MYFSKNILKYYDSDIYAPRRGRGRGCCGNTKNGNYYDSDLYIYMRRGGGRGAAVILWSRTSPHSTTIGSSWPKTTRRYVWSLIPNPVSQLKRDIRLLRYGHRKFCRKNFPNLHFGPIRRYFWLLIQNPLTDFKNHAPFRRYSPFYPKSYTFTCLSRDQHIYLRTSIRIHIHTYTYTYIHTHT